MFRTEHLDRRRVTLAAVVTLVALPSLWLTSRSESSGAPNVATAGVVIDDVGGGPEDVSRPTVDAMGTPGGAFLAADDAPVDPQRADEPLRIAVPRSNDARTVDGRASYRSAFASTDVCAVRGAPFGIRVRITNRDNGHSITCLASVSIVGITDDVILHTRAFAQIADLTDAPVPVEITW